MKQNEMTVKMMASLIVLLFPIVGLILILNSDVLGVEVFYLGIFLIFLFPLVIVTNIIRMKGKGKGGRR